MEYLDPKRQRRHRITLWLGYGLITIAIAIGVVILLWETYGYSLKNGQVIQNGMVFIASQPNPANIYINGVLNPSTTNARLTLQAGNYLLQLEEAGYRTWSHEIAISGGTVIHYDYPLLIPNKLTPHTVAKLNTLPEFASQSPNQQLLILGSSAHFGSFTMYNLTQPQAAPVALSLPSGLLTPAVGSQSWQVVGWANDNQHLLLEHLYATGSEFIELNTANPSQSVNLNQLFNVVPTSVALINQQYNQFYFYNSNGGVLESASLSNSAVLTPVLSGILAYDAFGNNQILYVTANGAPAGQVAVRLDNSSKSYLMHYLPTASTYLLDMASYAGDTYAAVGDSADNIVYVYHNPLIQAAVSPASMILPFRALRIANPNYLTFSNGDQFILAQNGVNLAVYNIRRDMIYLYALPAPLDAPQTNVTWMDNDRLVGVSQGKLIMFDYDNTNRQNLIPALPQYPPFFAPGYQSFFTLNTLRGQNVLQQTSLLAN